MSRGNGATPPGVKRTAELLGLKAAGPPPGEQGETVQAPPSRKAGGLRYRFMRDIVPDFWTPGLIDGVLERHGMTIIYGPSGCGKTAVIADMAARIATGMDWRGFTTMKGLVIYVASENSTSTERRLWAWQQRHRLAEVDVPLVLLESPVVLAEEKHVRAIVELVAQAQDESKEEAVFAVFDTLARTMAGDENSAQDMGIYVKMLDALKEHTRAHVAVIHHTGKDETRGARGSSALRAATDHELELSKNSGSPVGCLKLTKVREGGLEGTRYGYELTQRVLGVNRLGREVTTIVCEEAEVPKKDNEEAKAADAALVQEYLLESGPVSESVMRKELRLRNKDDANRKAWQRVKDDGVFFVKSGVVYLPGSA